MGRKVLIAGGLLLLAGVTGGMAQDRFELTPFYGLRFSNSVDAEGALFTDIEPDDSDAFGMIAGYWLGPHGQIEILWSRQDTDLLARDIFTHSKEARFGLEVDDWQVGGLYHWGMSDEIVRPFVSFGVGATHISPEADVDSETRFSWSLGGGAKFFFSDHLGVRLQARWTPVYVNSDDYVFCDWYGFCYVVEDAQYLYQTEISAGLSIGF